MNEICDAHNPAELSQLSDALYRQWIVLAGATLRDSVVELPLGPSVIRGRFFKRETPPFEPASVLIIRSALDLIVDAQEGPRDWQPFEEMRYDGDRSAIIVEGAFNSFVAISVAEIDVSIGPHRYSADGRG